MQPLVFAFLSFATITCALPRHTTLASLPDTSSGSHHISVITRRSGCDLQRIYFPFTNKKEK
ncbi:hypothetical protein FRC02_002225, partial [Tulasnella sp. 418]